MLCKSEREGVLWLLEEYLINQYANVDENQYYVEYCNPVVTSTNSLNLLVLEKINSSVQFSLGIWISKPTASLIDRS